MFTGIINGIGIVTSIEKQKKLYTYTVKLSHLLSKNLKIGDSVAHNGCCLTIKSIFNSCIVVDVIEETLKSTTLGGLNVGDNINIERSAKYGDEIGGHIISGHIINIASISKILKSNNNYTLWLKIKNELLMKYIFYKGFICIDGISLTVGNVTKDEFCINIIPETLRLTTIKNKHKGDEVNVEVDIHTQIIVDTVERLIKIKKD